MIIESQQLWDSFECSIFNVQLLVTHLDHKRMAFMTNPFIITDATDVIKVYYTRNTSCVVLHVHGNSK